MVNMKISTTYREWPIDYWHEDFSHIDQVIIHVQWLDGLGWKEDRNFSGSALVMCLNWYTCINIESDM